MVWIYQEFLGLGPRKRGEARVLTTTIVDIRLAPSGSTSTTVAIGASQPAPLRTVFVNIYVYNIYISSYIYIVTHQQLRCMCWVLGEQNMWERKQLLLSVCVYHCIRSTHDTIYAPTLCINGGIPPCCCTRQLQYASLYPQSPFSKTNLSMSGQRETPLGSRKIQPRSSSIKRRIALITATEAFRLFPIPSTYLSKWWHPTSTTTAMPEGYCPRNSLCGVRPAREAVDMLFAVGHLQEVGRAKQSLPEYVGNRFPESI